MTIKHYLDFDDIQKQIVDISLSFENKFSLIVAIARGGLIPATMLSHALNVKPIEVITASSYEGMEQQHLELTFDKELMGRIKKYPQEEILVVDDICDTGITFREIMDIGLQDASYACLVAKPHCGLMDRIKASLVVPNTTWVVMPWEVN